MYVGNKLVILNRFGLTFLNYPHFLAVFALNFLPVVLFIIA